MPRRKSNLVKKAVGIIAAALIRDAK
jgi:hypothetical protein